MRPEKGEFYLEIQLHLIYESSTAVVVALLVQRNICEVC